MPNANFRVIALSALVIAMSFLFYIPVKGQTYFVNGAAIEVGLAPEKSVIMLGEPIHLAFIVRNLSEKDLRFREGGDYRNRLGRPESYDVRAVRSDGKQVPNPEILLTMGGLVGGVKVPAGGIATLYLFLPHWALFEETGIYTIICERSLHFLDSDKLLSPVTSVSLQTSAQIEVVGSDYKKMSEIIEKLGAEILGEDEEKARMASLSLGYINDERAIPYYVKAIDSGDYGLMCSSLRSLGKYNADPALEGIKRGMKIDHDGIRKAGDRVTAISLAERVRLAAADALTESKHPEAISLLLSLRKDNHWLVRLRVVQTLGRLAIPEAIEILQEMSKDENEDVSREASRYLSAKEKN